MCTLIWLLRPDHDWPLLLATNRDEMIDRPWLPSPITGGDSRMWSPTSIRFSNWNLPVSCARMATEYHRIDHRICGLEMSNIPTSDQAFEELKLNHYGLKSIGCFFRATDSRSIYNCYR